MSSENRKKLNRREFLHGTAYTAAGLGLAGLPLGLTGCDPAGARTVHGACYHDCPDRCAWTVTAEGGHVTRFEASPTHPFTAGRLCDKMDRFPDDVTYHPDRILRPLKRVGPKGAGRFEPVSWEEAIAAVADRLQEVLSTHGGEAILPFSFAGNQGEIQYAAGSRFFARVGASRLDRTICGSTVVPAILSVNGTTNGVLPEDVVHSRYIVLWGTNPANSNQHLWRLIEEARRDGARVVVIDPFASLTARQADVHVQPLPGTDAALALGMMHVILRDGLQDQDYIDRYTSGYDALAAHVRHHTPERTARWTGLDPEAIETLARDYARSSPSLIRVLIGLEHHPDGGSACRAAAMLPALTGAWRHRGGGLMNMTYEFGAALDWSALDVPESLEGDETRTVNMVRLGRALTDPAMDPPVHAMIVFNANPAATIPDQNAVLRGLARDDLLTVVLEHFLTDTARYADYVFPATTCLENWDLLTSWGTPYLHLNEPAIAPLGEARTNTEFFRLLARAMGFEDEALYADDLDVLRAMLDSGHPYLEGVTFERLREEGWARYRFPEPWMPHAEGNFKTPSGKCLLVNPDIDPPVPTYTSSLDAQEGSDRHPLHLLTVKSPRNFLNSSHANVDRLREAEGPPRLDIAPADAEARGVVDGGKVRVFNDRGEVRVAARVSDRVRPGVVCLPHGHWPGLVEGGSSANALTADALTDLGGGAALQEARVEVVAV